MLLPASPAAAAPGGSCTVLLPETLVITRPTTRFEVATADDCHALPGLGLATWSLTRTADEQRVADLRYDSELPQPLVWDDDADGFGWFRYTGGAAFDLDSNTLTQSSGYLAVKAASRSTLVVTRNRSSVTVTVGASYYSGRRDAQVPWPGAAVQLQTSNALDGRWTTVATLTTGGDGLASTSLRAPAARYWRALTPTTRTVWGRYSVPVYR
jgi:hypothetical protein